MDDDAMTFGTTEVEGEPVGKGELVRKAKYGLEMIDTAFLDDPDVCENPKRMYEFAEAVTAGPGEVQLYF